MLKVTNTDYNCLFNIDIGYSLSTIFKKRFYITKYVEQNNNYSFSNNDQHFIAIIMK